MIKVESLEHVQQAIKQIRDFKKGYLTNLFFDPARFEVLIRHGILFSLSYDETILFFKKNNSFYNVYFCSTTIEKMDGVLGSLRDNSDNNVYVFDIIGPRPGINNITQILDKNCFFLYTSLLRMSRLLENKEDLTENKGIRFAEISDLFHIQSLLNRYFDKYAEQLPMDEEIAVWIENKNLLLFLEDENIIGFVIFDINGMTSYLRYWFVHPLHRNKKVGSSLLRRFFYESRNTKRQLFWVIENNRNAIIRYQHYGFANENLVDDIYININKKYEDRNN